MTPACASFYGTHANRDLEAEGYRELADRLARETGLGRVPD